MNLSEIFDNEKSAHQSENNRYLSELTSRWNGYLKGARAAFEKLKFLNDKGYTVNISNATSFNEKQARDGDYPTVRVNSTILIKNFLSENEDDNGKIGVSSLGKFLLSGEIHTYESFVKKLIRPY